MRRRLVAGGLVVLAILAIAIAAKYYHARRSEGYLIYPYLDLAEGGYNGNPYALSESGSCRSRAHSRDRFAAASVPPGRFGAAPYNLQLYDVPYKYPIYEARVGWDGDKRCRINCGEGGCSAWCR